METMANRRGTVPLLLVLYVISIISLIAVIFMERTLTNIRSSERDKQLSEAFQLGEAGIEQAIWEFNDNTATFLEPWTLLVEECPTGQTCASLQVPFTSPVDGSPLGSVDIQVFDIAGENPVVLSTGIPSAADSLRRTITITVILEQMPTSPFTGPLIINEQYASWDGNLRFYSSGTTYADGYDSRQGDYGAS